MAVFPLQAFTQDQVQVRYNDDYRSSPLGISFAGQPKGVYVGFVPSVLGSVLTLTADATLGYSCVKVGSNNDPSGMDIVLTDDVTLDFVGQPDVDFPLNVMLRVSYDAEGASPTTAEVFTRDTSVSIAVDEALLCVVDGPAATITVASDPVLEEQDTPLAYSHVDFGFMPGGSIESLQAAADIVNEVVAARVGIDSSQNASLSARISTDYGAEAMADRLSPIFRGLRSNDYAIAAGIESITVSGSFSEIDRDFGPAVTLDGSGSELSFGAVASPNDTTRNVSLIVDADTGYRPVDDATNRRVVYGRILGPNEQTVGGVWLFTNADQDVTATDGNGQATVELTVGDTILGPDGKYYEVATIIDDNNIELRTAYQGTTGSVTSTSIRRWTLALKTMNGSTEIDASLPSAATIRFFFPAFISMTQSNADWKLALHTAAEREPLPAATTSDPGTVRLAATGALLGSVVIQNAGVPLGGGPFHTVNFNSANASVIPGTVTGEIEVVEIGPVGVQGDDGPSGGPGDPGDPGPGYSAINPFEISAEFVNPSGAATPFSFTRDMGHSIRYIHGNVARFRDLGIFTATTDRLDITDVTTASATEGRIDISIGGGPAPGGDVAATLFLSSAGD